MFAVAMSAAPLSFAPASAGTVLFSNLTTNACSPSCWASEAAPNAASIVYQTYSSFSLSTSVNINLVTWDGFAYDYLTPSNNPVSPITTSWTISISADASGAVGSPLYSITVPSADVTATLLGTSTLPPSLGSLPVYEYQYSLVLPTNFLASSNTNYWFSVVSVQSGDNPEFGWSGGNGTPAVGSTPYDYSPQYDSFTSDFTNQADNRAFALSAVPELSTWGMMLTGFAGLGFVGYRASRKTAALVA
jgi:hypothetical protein